MSIQVRLGLLFLFTIFAVLIAPLSSSKDVAHNDLVDRYYSRFQTPGFFVEDLMSFYSDDIVFIDPTFEIVATGKSEVRKLYADLGTDQTNYANIKWDIKKTLAQDNSVVIRGNWSGTFYDCEFSVEFVTLWQLEAGLIKEQTDFFAASAFDRQVGWDSETGRATCEDQ